MEKRDSEKVSDGIKFAVWKFHMEICFEEKSIMTIVGDTIAKPLDYALDLQKHGRRLTTLSEE